MVGAEIGCISGASEHTRSHVDIERVAGATRHRRELNRSRRAVGIGEIARFRPGPRAGSGG